MLTGFESESERVRGKKGNLTRQMEHYTNQLDFFFSYFHFRKELIANVWKGDCHPKTDLKGDLANPFSVTFKQANQMLSSGELNSVQSQTGVQKSLSAGLLIDHTAAAIVYKLAVTFSSSSSWFSSVDFKGSSHFLVWQQLKGSLLVRESKDRMKILSAGA